MNNFKIIVYGVCLFLVCLSVSIIIKVKFGVEGDYLSAFSTLIATFVAFRLYTDWKIEHSLNLLSESQKSMKEVFSKLVTDYRSVRKLLISIDTPNVPEGDKQWIQISQELTKLFQQLNRAKFVIFEYKSCLKTLKENELLEDHKIKVDKLSNQLEETSNKFFEKMPLYTGNSRTAEKSLDVLNSCEGNFLNMDFHGSVVLPDFYYKYFKSLK